MKSENIQALRTQLEALSTKNFARGMYRLAQAYDDIVLECATVPDDAADFLVALFSCSKVVANPGIEHFLIELNVDFCKYSECQKNKLLTALASNASRFESELSRHAIGDFIARAYPSEIAFGSLRKLSVEGERSQHIAFVGMDILRRRLSKGDPLYSRVMEMWSSLQKL